MEAIDHFEVTLQGQPDHFWAQCLLAICDLQTQRPAEARVILSPACDAGRTPPGSSCCAASPIARWVPSTSEGLGALPMRRPPRSRPARPPDSRLPRAITARRCSSSGQATRYSAYALLVNRGAMLLQRHELPAAIADLQEAVRLKPTLFSAYTQLAEAFRQRGLLDQALDQLTRAIDLRPDREYLASLYRTRAGVQLELKDRAAALRDLEEAILHEPSDGRKAGDHAKRGELLYWIGRYQEALDACDAALRIALGAVGKPRLAVDNAGLAEAYTGAPPPS